MNLKSGPPLRAMNVWPASENATVSTMSLGPLGVSAAERSTLTMRLSGKMVV